MRVQSVLCIEIISFDWIPKPDFPCLGKFCPNFEILVDPVFLWITDSTNFRPYNKWIHISINTGLDYLGSIRKIGLKRFGQKTKDRVECKPSENWNFEKTTIQSTKNIFKWWNNVFANISKDFGTKKCVQRGIQKYCLLHQGMPTHAKTYGKVSNPLFWFKNSRVWGKS